MYMNAYLLLGPSNDQNMNVGQHVDFFKDHVTREMAMYMNAYLLLGPSNDQNMNVGQRLCPFRTV